MNPKQVVKGEARMQIMDTAEALFATQGVEGVSLRNINAGAGVSPGVLHYHFGSREVLIAELIDRHMGTLSEYILERLKPLRQQSQPSVTDLLNALILPLAQLGLEADMDKSSYLSFIARLHLERSSLLKEVSIRYQNIADDAYTLFGKALPTLDTTSINFRLSCACDIALNRLAQIAEKRNNSIDSETVLPSDQQQLNMLLEFLAAAIIGAKPDQ